MLDHDAVPEGPGYRRKGVVDYVNHEGVWRVVRGHVVGYQYVVRVHRPTGVVTIPLSWTLEVLSPGEEEVA